MRVYRLASKGPATAVVGCVWGSNKTTRIGPIGSAGRKAAVHAPIALNGKWVGAVEERPDGKAGERVYVISRNIGSGKSRRCLIGSGDAKSEAPVVRVVLMSQTGALSWAAITPTPDGLAPLIGACDSLGNRVLDSGAGVEINTLQLTGLTLHWRDASGPRSALLR